MSCHTLFIYFNFFCFFIAVRTLRIICGCAEEYRLLQENDPPPRSAAMWVCTSLNIKTVMFLWSSILFAVLSKVQWVMKELYVGVLSPSRTISCLSASLVSDFIRPHGGQSSAGVLSWPSGPCGALGADFLSKWVTLSGADFGLDALWERVWV